MTPETKRNMEHVHTETTKKRRCPDTSTDTGALEMFQLCEIRGVNDLYRCFIALLLVGFPANKRRKIVLRPD